LKKKITLNKKNLFNINKLKYLPKWIVILIDIFLVIFGTSVTFFFGYNYYFFRNKNPILEKSTALAIVFGLFISDIIKV